MRLVAVSAVMGFLAVFGLRPAQQVPVLNFDADVNYLKLPQDLYLGEVTGVAINSQRHLFVFSRGNTTGPAYGASAAQLLEFGRKQEASDETTGPLKHPDPPLPAEDGRFRQVTDVTWDPAGNSYISDGYINSRVAKIDSHGNWLKSWGDRGN